jgi:DUF1680 family protein
VFFQWKMNLAWQDAQFADLYEQTLYNALLGSLDLGGTAFYYTNPLDANAARTPWHNCPCCVGNIPRTLLMLPTWTYSKAPDGVYVNLFAGGRVDLGEVAGTGLEIVQATRYPWDGKVTLTVNPKTPKRFAVRIRAPRRNVSALYRATPDGDGVTRLAVNGVPVKAAAVNGYLEIVRAWKRGDTIELALPMPIQRVYASDKIVASANRPSPTKDKVALRVGPLVYNIEQVDQDISGALEPAAPLALEWRADLLGGVNVIKGAFAGGAPMLAIPNYARYNRNPPAPPPAPPAPPAPATPPAQAASQPPPGAPAQPAPRPAPPPPTSIVWIREK